MKTSIKNRLVRFFILISTFAVVLCFSHESAFAMSSLDVTRSGSLSLGFFYHESEDRTILLTGADFRIVRISDVAYTDAGVQHRLVPNLADLDINFDGMKASESNEAAKKVADFLQTTKVDGMEVKTASVGGDGNAYFSSLNPGMYLVEETGRTGVAADYTSVAPFLVSVPQFDGQANAWTYAVTANPKTSPVRINKPSELPTCPSKSTPPTCVSKTTPPLNRGKKPGPPWLPRTGEQASSPIELTGLLCGSLALLVWVIRKKNCA